MVTTKTDPPFEIAVYASNDIVSDRIRERGIWEEAIVQDIKEHLSPLGPRLFVDVGANIGFFTIYAAVLGSHVVAFEPLRDNADLLKANVCLNGVEHLVELYEIGLMSHPRDCVASGGGSNKGDSEVQCLETNATRNDQKLVRGDRLGTNDTRHGQNIVHGDRLDHYVQGRRIDMLKIDVEGFEQDVIESGMRAWRDPSVGAPRRIVFECNRNMAKSHGLDTLFWLDFTSEFACTFDHSVEINVPQWASAIPFVSGTVLENCGGANHGISCGD